MKGILKGKIHHNQSELALNQFSGSENVAIQMNLRYHDFSNLFIQNSCSTEFSIFIFNWIFFFR